MLFNWKIEKDGSSINVGKGVNVCIVSPISLKLAAPTHSVWLRYVKGDLSPSIVEDMLATGKLDVNWLIGMKPSWDNLRTMSNIKDQIDYVYGLDREKYTTMYDLFLDMFIKFVDEEVCEDKRYSDWTDADRDFDYDDVNDDWIEDLMPGDDEFVANIEGIDFDKFAIKDALCYYGDLTKQEFDMLLSKYVEILELGFR